MGGSKPLKKRPIRLISGSTIESSSNDKETSSSVVMLPTTTLDKKLPVEEKSSLEVLDGMSSFARDSQKPTNLVEKLYRSVPDENKDVELQRNAKRRKIDHPTTVPACLRASSERMHCKTAAMTNGTRRRVFIDTTNTVGIDSTKDAVETFSSLDDTTSSPSRSFLTIHQRELSPPNPRLAEQSLKLHEDSLILSLRIQRGLGWDAIAKRLSGRTPQEIQERYAVLQEAAWSSNEDAQVLKHYRIFGNNWTGLVHRLPWRDTTAIQARCSKLLSQGRC